MPERLILISHSSHLKSVSEREILDTLSQEDSSLPRAIEAVDTTPFADDIDSGDWERSVAYLRNRAACIVQAANEDSRAAELRYFGLAEIPHVVAFGAYVGDERRVVLTDFDRELGRWQWPSNDQTITVGEPHVPSEIVAYPGTAVVRVEITASIRDADVVAAVGDCHLANVTLTLRGQTPVTGIVRSAKDVDHVRRVFRETLAAIFAARPLVEAIHLFIAAPVSICFALGQELHLRSSVPFYTYRFRTGDDGAAPYTEAIRLSHATTTLRSTALTEAELEAAATVRRVWAVALENVKAFAATARSTADRLGSHAWWSPLRLPTLEAAAPFPKLPPIWDVIDERDQVALEPFDREFARDKDHHVWRVADSVLLGLHRAAGSDESKLQRLIQLFLFHEYVHDHNGLTKYTAAEVGAFPNCLERLDYAADLYALTHQLELARSNDPELAGSDEACKEYLADLIDLALRSFWAFERQPPINLWETRRLRRYLNWYWRHVQIKRSTTVDGGIHTLARQPAIELAGLTQRLLGRRVLANLTKPAPGEHLSLGLVLENERFVRITSAPAFNFDELLRAFRERDHAAIEPFFSAVFEDAASRGGAL